MLQSCCNRCCPGAGIASWLSPWYSASGMINTYMNYGELRLTKTMVNQGHCVTMPLLCPYAYDNTTFKLKKKEVISVMLQIVS